MADTTGNDGRGGGRNAGALLLRDAGDVREGLRAWSEALAHGGTGAWSVGGLALAILMRGNLTVMVALQMVTNPLTLGPIYYGTHAGRERRLTSSAF